MKAFLLNSHKKIFANILSSILQDDSCKNKKKSWIYKYLQNVNWPDLGLTKWGFLRQLSQWYDVENLNNHVVIVVTMYFSCFVFPFVVVLFECPIKQPSCHNYLFFNFNLTHPSPRFSIEFNFRKERDIGVIITLVPKVFK